MRCTPSHLSLPYLAVGIVLHSILVVSLLMPRLVSLCFASTTVSAGSTLRSLANHDPDFDDSRLKWLGAAIFSEPLSLGTDSSRIVLTLTIVAIQSLLIVGLLLERNRKQKAARALAQSEERYRNLVETQTELICRYLPDTTLIFVNDAYCRYFGKSQQELLGKQFLDLIPESAREPARLHVASLLKNPRSQSHEHAVLRADGSIGWQQWTDHVSSRNGRVELQGIGRDITERKEAENALMISEEFNRRIVESSSDCVKVLDLEGNLIYMSEQGQSLLEIKDIDALLGTSWIDLWTGPHRARAREAVLKASEGSFGSFRGFGTTFKGTLRWWHTVISPMRGASGNIERLLAVSRDVTEQEHALNALQESEERFAKAFRANPQPMSLTTLDEGQYIEVNDSFLQITGYRRHEVIGHTPSELELYEDPQARQTLLVDPLLRSEVVRNVELNFKTKAGDTKVMLSSAERIDLNGIACVLVASNDITKRKVLEENLRLSEREFSTLLQNSPDVIARLDRHLRYIYISPSIERVTGLPPEHFVGKTPRELDLADYDWLGFEEHCNEAINLKVSSQRAVDYRNKKYWTRVIPEFAANGSVESVMTISEDVTDRIRSDQELAKLTVRLFNLQDEERRRIARELHDGSAQNLFAISVNLAKLNQLNGPSEEFRQVISECQLLCDQSLQEIRTLSYLLHPPLLDEAGLVSALKWYVDGFTKRTGIYVDVYAQEVGRLPSDIEMALFRIVQEALTNVRKHSGSETASIRLEGKHSTVTLEIKDQGRGLHTMDNRSETNRLISAGVGIPGMRQRLLQLGGSLEIVDSESGTTISAIVPVRNGVNHVTNTSCG
ncbi:MAG TPA: PAS domain S-box protein [Pyrinomonadaceae bacterium]